MPLPPPPSAAATPATPATPEFKLSMFLPMIVLIGWSKLDIDTSEGTNALLYIRVLFYAIACSCIVCGLYIKSQVQASNNVEKITVTTPASLGTEASTEEMTVQAYDLKKAGELTTSMIMPLFIISLMHWKWEFVRPLVLQSVMMPNNIFDNQLFKIYILGYKAEGKLKRPWTKPASPFASLMGGNKTETVAPVEPKTKSKKKGKGKGKGKTTSRPSGDTGVTEQSAERAKDTKKDK
jgi:hypothetical protein